MSRHAPFKPITVTSLRFQYFPQMFIYEGMTYTVKSTQRTFTTHRILTFHVLTVDGHIFELIQDTRKNEWKGSLVEIGETDGS